MIGSNVSLLCKRFNDMNLDNKIVIDINNVFRIVIIIRELDITFDVFFPDAISFEIEVWILNDASDSNNEYVGIIMEYRDIPSNEMILVYDTFIIRPNNFVKNPPIISRSVDFKNIFFVRFLLYKFLFLLYN